MRKLSLYLPLVLLAASGCATKGDPVVEAVNQEKPAVQHGELMAKGFETWANSANLTADQKSRLGAIHITTAKEAMKIRQEITQAKSAMFKELAKGDYSNSMIDGFKAKIVKLDQERLDLMFRALAQVQNLLGKGPGSEKYFKYLEEVESYPFRRD